MITTCDPLTNPTGCTPGDIVGDVIGGAASSAWESVCKSFADAATGLMKQFADVFVAIPPVNVTSGGVRSVYAISLGLAASVAAILLLGQVIRTAFTRDGSALAHGLVGLGKAALAFMLTLTVAGTSLLAADELTAYIVNKAFGSPKGLQDKLTALFSFDPGWYPSLVLVLAVLGIVLIVVLWFELLLRNAAIAVLVATSPIAAAGQVSETTKTWWSKLVSAAVQLIILKPIIALVFGLGFSMVGQTDSKEVGTLLAGMLILLLAALAWPAIGRFFTFASVQTGGGAGLGAALGFVGGKMSGGGGPVGVNPAQFSQAAEGRTMAGFAGGGSAAGAGGSGAATGAAGSVAIPLVIAKAGIDMAQKAANSMTNRMEATAGHAGLHTTVPYAPPGGHVQHTAPVSAAATAAVQERPEAPPAPAAVPNLPDQSHRSPIEEVGK
ncbi:hypothetical protein AB0M47_26265 [Hamadaea sp. NPDC051192]|uniref:hypothetical protein n=1 Tax=Hamadaea sp. NPDC051192 TaxID=3154940 RepID=UPI0034126E79